MDYHKHCDLLGGDLWALFKITKHCAANKKIVALQILNVLHLNKPRCFKCLVPSLYSHIDCHKMSI